MEEPRLREIPPEKIRENMQILIANKLEQLKTMDSVREFDRAVEFITTRHGITMELPENINELKKAAFERNIRKLEEEKERTKAPRVKERCDQQIMLLKEEYEDFINSLEKK